MRKRPLSSLSSIWNLAWLAPAFAVASEATPRIADEDTATAFTHPVDDDRFNLAVRRALTGEQDPHEPAQARIDENAPQRDFMKVAVVVNGHWAGFSWLTLQDNGRPCAEVAAWLEWGVTPLAAFAPQDPAGNDRCVLPQHAAPLDQPEVLANATPEETGLAEEAEEDPVRMRYDLRRQQLNVRITDALMSRSRGYVPPARLDYGVDALRVDYQLSASRSAGANAQEYDRRTSLFGALNLGANAGPWRFRSNHVYSDPTVGNPEWNRLETYVQRDIRRWRGKLLLGEGVTDSLLFDSMPFTGAQLASDDNLLPDHLGAFSPVVRGNAQGSAEVFIRQRGVLFYHAIVAPGPFAFYDVRPPSSSGDLNVTVREADGTEHVSVVPFISMPLLVHRGALKYAFSAGRYRRANVHPTFTQPAFVQASVGVGLPYRLSAFAGLLNAHGYHSSAAGLGWHLGDAGALSVDVARSRLDAPGLAQPAGHRVRVRYAKSFASTGTGISADWRRFGGGHFRTLEETLQRDADAAFWRDLFGDDAGSWVNESIPRRRIRFDFQQNVGDTGNVYATFTGSGYAGKQPTRAALQIGATWYGERFDIDLQVGYRQTGSQRSKSFQASVSIPLSAGSQSGSLRYGLSASRDDDGVLTWGNQLSGSALRDYRLNYALSQQHSSESGDDGTAHASYLGDAGRVDAGYGQGRGYRKIDVAVAGSIVGYRSTGDGASSGIVLGQSLGDTIAVVDAPGYANASVDGQLSTRTDSRGRAVISNLRPYRVNRAGLDSIDEGGKLDYSTLFREVAPVSGAVIYVPIRPEPMLTPDLSQASPPGPKPRPGKHG